jgi:hypothetical protein
MKSGPNSTALINKLTFSAKKAPTPEGDNKHEEDVVGRDNKIGILAFRELNIKLEATIEANKLAQGKNIKISEQNAAISLANESILDESQKVSLLEKENVNVVEEKQGDYIAKIHGANPAYIFFYNAKVAGEVENKKCDDGRVLSTLGLKFHISLTVDTDKRESLCNGCDIVRDILSENETFFKILRIENIDKIKPRDQGKLITIYTNFNPNINLGKWKLILQRVTQELESKQILPGPRAIGSPDKPEEHLKGSRFISYRYDDEHHALDQIHAILKPDRKLPIGSLKLKQAQLEIEDAKKTMIAILALTEGVVSDGPKKGWPKKDPVELIDVGIVLRGQSIDHNAASTNETDKEVESENQSSRRLSK